MGGRDKKFLRSQWDSVTALVGFRLLTCLPVGRAATPPRGTARPMLALHRCGFLIPPNAKQLALFGCCAPNGIRTHVAGLKSLSPRPLDDGSERVSAFIMS